MNTVLVAASAIANTAILTTVGASSAALANYLSSLIGDGLDSS